MSRRSRFVRSTPTIPMKLTERDLRLLATVAELRFARSWHLHELFFEGRTLKVCQVRLQKLWLNGYVDRLYQPLVLIEGRAQRCSSTPIYQLSSKGAAALRTAGQTPARRAKPPSPFRLTHDLLVLDARVAISVACARSLARPPCFWWDEGTARTNLQRHSTHSSVIVPDAAVTLPTDNGDPSVAYLIEVDTGSEPLSRRGEGTHLEGKLLGYARLHQQGVLQQAVGCKAVRVAFITTSATRADNLLNLIARLSIPAGLFLVTTTDATVPGVVPGPTLRPSKVFERVLRCARCPSWHSFADIPKHTA